MRFIDQMLEMLDRIIIHPISLGCMAFSFALVLSYVIIAWYVTPYFLLKGW